VDNLCLVNPGTIDRVSSCRKEFSNKRLVSTSRGPTSGAAEFFGLSCQSSSRLLVAYPPGVPGATVANLFIAA
jgi:hypothetical protein